MSKIAFTELAERSLTSDEKREARAELHRDGSLRGWCTISTKKNLAWQVTDQATNIGMVSEVSSL